MKQFFYILITFVVLSSCSEYQKALKAEGDDAIATKFKMGEDLYNEGKFAKANKLFAQIVPNYRGKPQAEKLMYLYSMSYYKMRDFYISGYQFERFAASYPKSEKLEEASFLSAKSYYMLSPVYTKDQKETKEALEKIQTFIDLFPESKYLAEANELTKELDFKLQQKAFAIAKQYNDIAPGYTRDFNAAIKSFDNFLFDFPGTILTEKVLYYRLDASYQQAMNSIEYKKSPNGIIYIRKERLEKAKEYIDSFIKTYTNSEYIESVNLMSLAIEGELKNYTAQ